MTRPSPPEVTQLLLTWGDGDQAALEKLTPPVYEELRRPAHRYMARENPGHALRTTALVTSDSKLAKVWLLQRLGRNEAR